MRMNLDINVKLKGLPKDARWQDFISKLRCPQCQSYKGSSMSHLERHVILHCKSRPTLIRNHYVRKLKHLSTKCNEDVLDLVRLTLEAKSLQWLKEGIPEIPLLLKYNEDVPPHGRAAVHSRQLDLWRLWQQEMDYISQDFYIPEMLELFGEAENLQLEDSSDDTVSTSIKQGNEHQFNLQLMSSVSAKLKQIPLSISDEISIDEEDIDIAAIERLEREASRLSPLLR